MVSPASVLALLQIPNALAGQRRATEEDGCDDSSHELDAFLFLGSNVGNSQVCVGWGTRAARLVQDCVAQTWVPAPDLNHPASVCTFLTSLGLSEAD